MAQVSLQLSEAQLKTEQEVAQKLGLHGPRFRTRLVTHLYDQAAATALPQSSEVIDIVDRIRAAKGQQDLTLEEVVLKALVSYLRRTSEK